MADSSISQNLAFGLLLLLICAAYTQKIEFVKEKSAAQIQKLSQENVKLTLELAEEKQNKQQSGVTNEEASTAQNSQSPQPPAKQMYYQKRLAALVQYVKDMSVHCPQ